MPEKFRQLAADHRDVRLKLLALPVLLGSLLFLSNHVGVIAGMVDPPPGYQPAHYIRNLRTTLSRT